MARAFDDDPFFRWMLPSDAARKPWLEWIMRVVVESEPASVLAWERNGSLAGVLAAVRPGRWPHPKSQRVRAYTRAGMVPRPTARIVVGGLRAQQAIDRVHTSSRHWYVEALAVDPIHQGAGGGRELLSEILEHAKDDGALAYLETTKPENLAWYQRFGFEVVDELRAMKGAPPIWTMQTRVSAGR
jgi:ribosomal protein S18 acetylase RimI-like enzyme